MITLKDFDHLIDDPRVRFMYSTIHGREIVTICYMIADSDFWKLPMATECRGIVFDVETQQCICRPFEKFFNVGERAETMKNSLDFTDCYIYEKRDGSMITPVFIDDVLYFKSKKSFSSDVAVKATKLLTENVIAICHALDDMGYTPIFEFTHQEHQIVIDYGDIDHFTLLAARKMEDGEYMQYVQLKKMAGLYNVPIIKEYTRQYCSSTTDKLTVEEMFQQMDNIKNFEGYVLHLSNGIRVKQKCAWYLLNHYIMTDMRERDIVRCIVEETIDDIKSHLSSQDKDLSPVLEIERRVVDSLDSLRMSTESLLTDILRCSSRKDAALMYNDHPCFSLAMKLYDKKDPRYKEFWIKKHLNDYSLRTIYNLSFDKSDT